MKTAKSLLALVGVVVSLGWLSIAAAQDQQQQPQQGAGDAAATESAPEGAAAEAPAAPVKPKPAEVMPLASKGLLLDIVNTGERLVAVGDHGDIVASVNGDTWAQAEVPVRAPLTAVYFVDAKNGWAVGHDAAVVHTADGGRTWTLQNFQPELEKPLLDVFFLDNQHGFAVGAYGMLKETLDGGQSWNDVKNAISEGELHLNSIICLGDGALLIAGEQGTIGLSNDQGKTWSKLNSPYEASLFGALPVGDKGAMIYGLRGNIFVSQDVRAGKWAKIETGNVSSMFGGTKLADGRLVMVGLNGVIWVTDANGANIKRVNGTVGTTQSGVVGFKGGLLMVGESGVQVVPNVQ
ncbi:MAG TPA: YCF48-related protein [Nevskiaceae bacterium]|nr:YCF48-related protein [Nevskiaceae bacterium]